MNACDHGLRTPREKIASTARPKIHSHSQIFKYGQSIFCLPHRPKFSDFFFDFCLHWVAVVREPDQRNDSDTSSSNVPFDCTPLYAKPELPHRRKWDHVAGSMLVFFCQGFMNMYSILVNHKFSLTVCLFFGRVHKE